MNEAIDNGDFIICYEDGESNTGWAYYHDPCYYKSGAMDLSVFMKDNPNIKITAAFRLADNIVNNKILEEKAFKSQCYRHGFEPGDYRAPIAGPDNNTPAYLLLGFLPQNTKYKALLLDISTGKRIKATLGFARSRMISKS